MPNWEAYAEAEKRGILPPDKAAIYAEAKKLGLVPELEPKEPTAEPPWLTGAGAPSIQEPPPGYQADPFATSGTAGQVATTAAQVADLPLIPLHWGKQALGWAMRKAGGPFIEPYPAYDGLGIPEACPAGVMPTPSPPTNVGTFREHQVGEYPRPEVTTTMAETLPEVAEFMAVAQYLKWGGKFVGKLAGLTDLRCP